MPEPLTEHPAGRVRTWLAHHGFSIVASLGRLVQRPLASLLTITVMALALTLPAALGLALENLARLQGSVQASHDVTVFLAPGTPAAQVEALVARLRARADVQQVQRVSPGQALDHLRREPDFAAAIDALGEEAARAALPEVLHLMPRGDASTLVASVQALPGVERVQYDAVWQQRLQHWLALGTRLVQVLAVLLGLGAVLVVGNTVRLDIQARSEEISVLLMLGASEGFVRRPFLYLGLWYGLAAGALALALLRVIGILVQPPLDALAASYGSRFTLQGPALPDSLALLLVAILLGWLGALLAVGRHLRENRPMEE